MRDDNEANIAEVYGFTSARKMASVLVRAAPTPRRALPPSRARAARRERRARGPCVRLLAPPC